MPDQRWRQHQSRVLRQQYTPGDQAFFDYAGAPVPTYDRTTGTATPAPVLVAVLGYNQAVYTEVRQDQTRASWLAGPVHAVVAWGASLRAGCRTISRPG